MSVRLEIDDRGVPLVLLDRPSRRNAINMDMIDRMREGLRSAGPVLILGSTDRRAFSSGADLDLDDPARAGVSDALYSLYQEMRDSETVIVAAADGYAWGGGAQLLLACDLRIGGPDLNIRFMGLGHGLVVGAWGLPELIGRGRAVDLCVTMRPVGAEEALRIGLVERLVAEPLEEAVTLASSLMRVDARSLAGVKRVVSDPDPHTALILERQVNSGWDGSIPQRSDG